MVTSVQWGNRGSHRPKVKHKLFLILMVSLPTLLFGVFYSKWGKNQRSGKLVLAPKPLTSQHTPQTLVPGAANRLPALAPAAIQSCTSPVAGYIPDDLQGYSTFRYADEATDACARVPSCTGAVVSRGPEARYSLRSGNVLRDSPSGEVSYRCGLKWPNASIAQNATPTVLIVSPIKDAVSHLDRFFSNIYKMDYPKGQISIALLDGSMDNNTSDRVRQEMKLAATHGIRQLRLFKSTDRSSPPIEPNAEEDRHSLEFQLSRRKHLAKQRNLLLSEALRAEHEWVLWIDVDVHQLGGHLIQNLLSVGQSIVVPNVVMPVPSRRSYDLNSWRKAHDDDERAAQWSHAKTVDELVQTCWEEAGGTDQTQLEAVQQRLKDGWVGKKELVLLTATGDNQASLDKWKRLLLPVGLELCLRQLASVALKNKPNRLQLEGYAVEDLESDLLAPTNPSSADRHKYLSDLRNEGAAKVVELEGVGGAVLLVKSQLHREGLNFPSFPYKGRIETEGLALMAREMGTRSFGMPYEEVEHL